MMAKSVITNIARQKMAKARYDGTPIEKVKYIALGDGGVNEAGEVIYPLPENVKLKNELIRKEYNSCTKISETSYEYIIELGPMELAGKFISEAALIDEAEDVIAFSNFLAKGKDETEVIFSIRDNY
ncbi:phage tail protein [Lachnospiraceae bacterium MD308]|nr:phage tail protein [Lachnospiraceae bacterium MD308]